MYFLENDRRYCRTYSNLDATVQKELSFFQQKAKEWAEVHVHVILFSVRAIHVIHTVSLSLSITPTQGLCHDFPCAKKGLEQY